MKENKIQEFFNEMFGSVRTVEIDGKVGFVASDIAKALGYKNAPKAIKDHCRRATKHEIQNVVYNEMGHTTSSIKGAEFIEMNIIFRSDVIRLIVKSKLPNAEVFENWIFDVVIPAIMDDGMYIDREENTKSKEELQKLAEEALERKILRKYGIGIRNKLTDRVKEYWSKEASTDKYFYAKVTNELCYKPLFGITASEMRSARGLGKVNMRDHLSSEELSLISDIEDEIATLAKLGMNFEQTKIIIERNYRK